jgi:hypothetical protein
MHEYALLCREAFSYAVGIEWQCSFNAFWGMTYAAHTECRGGLRRLRKSAGLTLSFSANQGKALSLTMARD